jgi:transposase
MNQKRQRKDFTEDFKKDAVSLVTERGYSCSEVARRLGINHTNVSRWVRHYRDQLESPPQKSGSLREIEDEVKRLRKENKRLLMEREILKKAAAFFANESNRDSISSGST